jgi:hypothetical protein
MFPENQLLTTPSLVQSCIHLLSSILLDLIYLRRWASHAVLKHQQPINNLNCVTSQKSEDLYYTAMEASSQAINVYLKHSDFLDMMLCQLVNNYCHFKEGSKLKPL